MAASVNDSSNNSEAITKELVDMFENETGPNWEQYAVIKGRILRGNSVELRGKEVAELLTELDELQEEAIANGLFSLEERVDEVSKPMNHRRTSSDHSQSVN